MKGNVVKTILISITCILIGFGAAYLILPLSQNTPQAAASGETAQLYTCGMHPEIISEEPGICPICNMKLTPKRESGDNEGAIRIDPATKQNMGLVTTQAEYRKLTKTVSTFGKISVPDPNRYTVNLKVDGWVERLYVDEQGQSVSKGQPLLEIYSPELVAAQRELLVAKKSNSNASMIRLANAASQRLQNWDISEDQLRRLEDTGEVKRTMIIRSPANGIVKNKAVSKGDRISARSLLYEIVDLSKVWVEASVYEQDLPYVQVGQKARVNIPSLPGQKFDGEVTFISPILDDNSQAEIRLTLDNTDNMLKPEMYAEVFIENSLDGERLAIPRSAVINSGTRQLVFVASADETYKPHYIETGAIGSGDMIAIEDGLMAGDDVVVSGQFLLDSETRLSEAIGAGGAGGHAHQHGAQHADSKEMDHDEMEKAEASNDPYDIHTCPMPEHFDVLNYGPGECPECGMALVPVSETENIPVYVCPMPQCGVAEKEPGLCPVCNMKLVEYEVPEEKADSEEKATMDEHAHGHDHSHDQMEMQAEKQESDDSYNIHTCPMPEHFHVLNYGPGECPECGMALVPVGETENSPVYVCPMPQCEVAEKEPGLCPVCNMKLFEYEPEESDDR